MPRGVDGRDTSAAVTSELDVIGVPLTSLMHVFRIQSAGKDVRDVGVAVMV